MFHDRYTYVYLVLYVLFNAFTGRRNYLRGIASKLLHASRSRNKINKSLVSLAVRNTKTKTSWHTTSRPLRD